MHSRRQGSETRGIQVLSRHIRPPIPARNLRGSTPLVVATALAGLVLAGAAVAQEDIGEIVVTARKVEERLQDVPLAITAFDEKGIEAAGIESLSDIAELAPGLQFYSALGEALPTPIIRGVAPTNILAKENNAAIFVNGVYVTGREGLNFSQLDLERIEVVKGPQSALYGRNAFSGAINFVTKRPTDIFEAKSAVTTGNDGKMLANGSVSGPLIEGLLRGRVGAAFDDWDGSYDDPLHGYDVGGYRYRTTTGSFLLTPTDGLSILGDVYYSDDDIDDSSSTALQANCENTAFTNPRLQNSAGVPYGTPIYGNFCGEVPSLDGSDIPKTAGASGEERELWRASLNIDWDIGVGTITALTGYSDTQQDGALDFGRMGDSVPFVYCDGVMPPGDIVCAGDPSVPLQRFFTGVIDRESGNDTREISQELRFTSPLDRPFRYSGGGYFYDVRDEERFGQNFLTGTLPSNLDPANGIGAFCPCQGSPGNYFAPFGNAIFVLDPGHTNDQIESMADTRSWAGFASMELDFLERWKVRGEVRYTYEEKDYRLWTVPELRNDDNGVFRPRVEPPTREKDDWTWLSGRVTLDYKPNDDWMIYTSIANASKSGGFTGDAVGFIDPVDGTESEDVELVEAYDPEENWTVELGIKGRSSDGRLGLDLSTYRIDWTEIVLPQVLTEYVDPRDGQLKRTSELVTLSRNTGDAVVWGWELVADAILSEEWRANIGVSYTDSSWGNARQATYEYFPSFYVPNPDPDGPPSIGGDISGHEMLRVAPWTANATLSYRKHAFTDWDLYGSSTVSWKDSWYIGNDNQGWIPSSTFVNLRLGMESQRYTVEFWVDNLFEYDEPIGAYRDIFWSNTQDMQGVNNPPTTSLGDFPPIRLTVNQPRLRTFGLTARVRFGGALR